MNTVPYAFTTDGEEDQEKEKKLASFRKRNNDTFLKEILGDQKYSEKNAADQSSDQFIDSENESECETECESPPTWAKKPKKQTK